jgi:hypothetical protein
MKNYMVCILIIICIMPTAAADNENIVKIRRISLMVGHNDGGKNKGHLQYAIKDAKTLSEMFTQIGGVKEADSHLLKNPDSKTLDEIFDTLRTEFMRINSEKEKGEFIFYYSGHSSITGLLLGNEVYAYEKLKKKINHLSAKVNIVILDSCASGRFIREKGITDFYDPFITEPANASEGYAYLTSCTATQKAYELDELESSLFSHYVQTGLRGAADVNGDKKITLSEVFDYAKNKTTLKSAELTGTSMNPTYKFNLKGTRETVLTNIRTSTSMLLLTMNEMVKVFISNKDDILVADFTKMKGKEMALSLNSGNYSIKMEDEKYIYSGVIKISPNNALIIHSFNGLTKTLKGSYGKAKGKEQENFITIAAGFGMLIPVALMSDFMQPGYYPVIRTGYSLKTGFCRLHFGITTGVCAEKPKEGIVDGYTMYSIPAGCSLAFQTIFSEKFFLFTEVAGGIGINIIDYPDLSTEADKTIISAYIGPAFGVGYNLTPRITISGSGQLMVMVFNNQISTGITPGLRCEYNFR